MKTFRRRHLREAIAYAAQGGQALHLHRMIAVPRRAPRVFARAIEAGEPLGHLFDQDRDRLVATVLGLGVCVIRVERPGMPGQHIDLVGRPLQRAITQAALESIEHEDASR